MSFSRLSSLPFRLTSKKNKVSYICDIGDIRFTVDDVNLLDGGPVTVQEPLTGVPAEYAYSMKLPALVSIAQQANAKEFALQRDLLSVMMYGRLTSATTDSVGTITNIIHNGGNTVYNDIIANITYRIVGEVGNPNRLQGIISFDAFTTLPGGFSNTIIASVTDAYGLVTDIDDLLIYGTGSTVTVKKTSVDNETAMLTMTSVNAGDKCYRSDLQLTFVNLDGSNGSMSDWAVVPADGAAADMTVVQEMITASTVPMTTHIATISGNPHHVTKVDVGLGNVANVDLSDDVALNTAVRHSHLNKVVLDATTAAFTSEQANAIAINSAKVGITPEQAGAIVVNTAKVGITAQQAAAITTAAQHVATVTGNPHQVTKADVGLGNVPNHDFTAEVAANTAKVGITPEQTAAIIVNSAKVGITAQQAADIVAADTHVATISGNPHHVTKIEVGLGVVPNTDFTADIAAANVHRATVVGNPHNVTKTEVGLGNVPNVDFTADIAAAYDHIAKVTGNPHHVTKADVGLGNVPNVDCTNAANITTGILPTSVLPALAITDTFVVASEAEQLALTVQKGDIAVRTDLNISYINTSSNNTSMADWQELRSPTDHVLSVNNKVGVVSLSTTDIGEGVNLYYTEERVNTNLNVVANTASRHTHANKSVLDDTTAPFTTEQGAAIIANTAKIGITPEQTSNIITAMQHVGTTSGNPHGVTKAEVGLNNVPNHDFTAEVNANTAKVGITPEQAADIVSANTHRAIVSGNPHQVTKIDVGLGNVPDVDFTTDVAANTAHRTIISGNPHHVTKADVGLGDVPNIDFTNAIAANTAKVGITTQQAADIVAANAHIATVSGNPHQVTKAEVGLSDVPNTNFTSDVALANAHRIIVSGNPHHVTKAEVGLGDVPNVDFSSAVAVTLNHVSLTSGNPHQVTKADVGLSAVPNHDFTAEVNANTAKVGITTQQAADISAANAHRAIISGNPHQVTKIEIGLGNVPNHDFTAEVNANTAHRQIVSGNPHNVTKAEIGLSVVPNTDFTNDVSAANAHIATITGNPHHVTKVEVGLGNVPNTDFTTDVALSVAHAHLTSGNPHHVTKAEVGLSNVPNIDCTNASNITTGTLPTSVLPPLAITDTFVVASEAEQLTLTVQKGDICVRTDEHRSYINVTGNNSAITDWQELQTPTDAVLSVNGQVGAVILTTTNIAEGTNKYYTDARVSANTDVAANTAARHTHANKAILDATTAAFTTEANTTLAAADAHRLTTSGNPHQVTKADVGLGNVPNTDFSNDVTLANEHRAIVSGNPHQVTKAEVGLGNVPNHDFTDEVATAINHAAMVTGNPHHVTKIDVGLGNVPNHDFTDEVNANTAKVGITPEQTADIASNSAHRLITSGNPHRVTKDEVGLGNVPDVDFTNAVALTVAHAQLTSGNPHRVDKADVGLASVPDHDFTTEVETNSAHRLITSGNPHNVTKAEVGLSVVPNHDFTAEVVANTQHRAIVSGNPHHVTKAEVGLSEVPNHDFTTEVNANTAKVGITPEQAAAIVVNTAKVGITTQQAADIVSANQHRAILSGNPHQVTKTEIGLSNVPNHDFTDEVNANTAKVGITSEQAAAIISSTQHQAIVSGNPHQVTKADVGLANVPNTDFTSAVTLANAHIATVTGNPHHVTKADVGLSNVPNVDCTNASNITTGTLPSSVLPPIAITDTFVAASETEQLALTVQKGDIAVRTDLNQSFINKTGNNTSMTDWQLMLTPTDSVLSVNGQVGVVVLSTTNIAEGTNKYYTEARVSANTDVAANTAARHTHTNKAILDATTAAFTSEQAAAIITNTAKVGITTQQAADIVAADAHVATITGNPHHVTKAEVGLSNVPNYDFTNEVNLANAHRAIVSGNPHQVTKADVGLSVVPNTDFTTAVAANTAHRAIVSGNPHQVTKTDVGLSNVPNIDCTNASNITTGTLPSSVLPPIAITDTYVVASETAQLALTVQKGDIAVRTDLHKSFVNRTGFNASIADWQELQTPTDAVLSVNGQVGTVVLTTTNIAEGTNLYYTDARVNANTNVAANTAARHTHTNKTALDAVSGINTGDQTNITGNAGTATKLATPRTINGVTFDGSADITIAVGDVTLAGVQTLTNKTLEAVKLTKSVTEQIAVMADSIITAANGTILTKAIAANTTFTDALVDGQSVTLMLTGDNLYTITWPTVTWVTADGNIAPLLSGADVFVFWKVSSILYGTLIGSH